MTTTNDEFSCTPDGNPEVGDLYYSEFSMKPKQVESRTQYAGRGLSGSGSCTCRGSGQGFKLRTGTKGTGICYGKL